MTATRRSGPDPLDWLPRSMQVMDRILNASARPLGVATLIVGFVLAALGVIGHEAAQTVAGVTLLPIGVWYLFQRQMQEVSIRQGYFRGIRRVAQALDAAGNDYGVLTAAESDQRLERALTDALGHDPLQPL